jgi:hypothetical protein
MVVVVLYMDEIKERKSIHLCLLLSLHLPIYTLNLFYPFFFFFRERILYHKTARASPTLPVYRIR